MAATVNTVEPPADIEAGLAAMVTVGAGFEPPPPLFPRLFPGPPSAHPVNSKGKEMQPRNAARAMRWGKNPAMHALVPALVCLLEK